MTESTVRHCDDREQRLAAFRELLNKADRELLFYAPRLDGGLTDDAEALSLLQGFLTSSPRHNLRILVTEPTTLVRDCPRLLALCRRLPSRCSLKVPARDAEPLDETLYCADRHHALHRPPTERTLHLFLSDYPQRVSPLRDRVDELWAHAVHAADFQQLSL